MPFTIPAFFSLNYFFVPSFLFVCWWITLKLRLMIFDDFYSVDFTGIKEQKKKNKKKTIIPIERLFFYVYICCHGLPEDVGQWMTITPKIFSSIVNLASNQLRDTFKKQEEMNLLILEIFIEYTFDNEYGRNWSIMLKEILNRIMLSMWLRLSN